MRISVPRAVLLLGSLVPAAFGQDAPNDYERFQLYTECKPVALVIEGLPDDAKSIKLTKDRVRIAVESRLRSARLYDSTVSAPHLYVNINVVRSGYSIGVQFSKMLYDSTTTLTYPAITWEIGSAGTHGRDAGFILSNLSEHIDEFLAEYLRLNESACE